MGKLKLTSEVEEYEIYRNLIIGRRANPHTGKIENLNLEDFFNMVKKNLSSWFGRHIHLETGKLSKQLPV